MRTSIKKWGKLTLAMMLICGLHSTKASTQDSTKAMTTEKTISLIAKDGAKLNIGTIKFTTTNTGESFKITMNYKNFSEHFLSMRPFRCIDGQLTVCHLIYPYKTKSHITTNDLKDLEYAFLFIHKSAKEYGINFWNGIYYKMQRQKDGSITGKIWETDMNELASPPDNIYDRPIGGDDLVEGITDKHRFPQIEIK